jgi:hypothetical protein
MPLSTIYVVLLASPFATSLLSLTIRLVPAISSLGAFILSYKTGPISPESTDQFESGLNERLREIGRVIVEWVFNHLEPEAVGQASALFLFDGNYYRRRQEKSPHRLGIGTLFGVISLWRIRYEPCDSDLGLKCLFPLEQWLGLVGSKATPALASRIGKWSAQHTQETVRALLREEHQVAWSVTTLRAVVAALAEGLAPLTLDAQVNYLLKLLRQAQESTGGHRPVLSTGRDGIFVPIVKETKYREASTSTVSVLDRSGKRLGTIYLGHMPEPGQGTLSQQLTELLKAVFMGWDGPLPRLQYVTDGGHHPTEYYAEVLQKMKHPGTGKLLEWEWVLDYYHACLYITKMAEALFGKNSKEAASWSAKMRRWLRDKKAGINRVLHSAAAHACWGRDWTEEEQNAYEEAYAYLRKRMGQMNYWSCRQRGLAIGSGITEAACKILFTQRFKQSGMKWSFEGGQVVVNLRTIWLSRLWNDVYPSYLRSMLQGKAATQAAFLEKSSKMTA